MTANRIIQHIFQLPDIKQVEEHSIDRIISQYPYFTAARLLLAKKQYTEQKNLLSPAVKKAQHFSNNMHYFYRFITTDEAVVAAAAEAAAFTAPLDEIPAHEAPAFEAAVEETVMNEAPVETAPDYQAAVETTPAYEATVETTSAYEAPAETTPAYEAPAETAPAYEAPVETTPAYEAPQAASPLVEEPAEIITFTYGDELTVTPDNVTVAPEQAITQEQIKEEEQEMVPEPIIVASDLPVAITAEEVEQPIKIFPLDMPALDDTTTLTFQPLYSDDYFAYKRLKDPQKADELNEKGKAEMKSFTSWLKEMKTSFADKASKDWYRQQLNISYQDADPEVSEVVEKMAMSSITLNNDMVTETLAEIWAKQRQYNTAILIYQKLSLLNPAKSAYFAQKIKELQILTDKN